MRRQAGPLADEQAAQVHLEMVPVEHAEPARESLDPHRRARLGDHRVEQTVRLFDIALRLGRPLQAELLRDVRQRALEVCRELPRVVAAGAPGDSIALEQHHERGRSSAGGRTPSRCPAMPAPITTTSAALSDSSGRGGPSGASCATHGDRFGRSAYVGAEAAADPTPRVPVTVRYGKPYRQTPAGRRTWQAA